MARIRDVQWSWESKDGNTRVGYAAIDGRISIADLIANMQEVAPGAGLDEIQVNFATVKWTRPATVDELAEREKWNESHQIRQEKWERDTLQRLTEKYRQNEK